MGAALSAPVAGLAFAADGTLWASGGTVFKSPGFVWRITPAGVVEEWLQIPDAVFLNGCACLPDENRLLICESISGRILAIGRSEQTWSAWITDDQLRPVNDTMPGANGIKYRAGYVYVSITDRNRIERIPIDNDNSAGPIEVVADHVRADDFAFSRSGALYVATHAAHTVLRLDPDGGRATIAGPEGGDFSGVISVAQRECALNCKSNFGVGNQPIRSFSLPESLNVHFRTPPTFPDIGTSL